MNDHNEQCEMIFTNLKYHKILYYCYYYYIILWKNKEINEE